MAIHLLESRRSRGVTGSLNAGDERAPGRAQDRRLRAYNCADQGGSNALSRPSSA
jgi:hypothetical protein